MATHQLSEHFDAFFGRVNPAQTWIERASSEYNSVKDLIEGSAGAAAQLNPQVFLQGSYRRQTAIHTINDIDVVVLCGGLQYPPPAGGGTSWGRDQIFSALAQPLLAHGPYSNKVSYNAQSMCIKLDLGIKVEVLPAVRAQGVTDTSVEPFYLYRPETGKWEQGFARYHQKHLTDKNARAGGNFIPCIKAVKHIRSRFNHQAVSFHIECLLHAFHDGSFLGSPADYMFNVISVIGSHDAQAWWSYPIKTPCEDRTLFSASEWSWEVWSQFHALIASAQPLVTEAVQTGDRARAIACWQEILGADYFPAY